MMVMPNLSRNIHIFLVEPSGNLNIGAVARAMSNLGFNQLHLISPKQFDPNEAKQTACWAANLIDTLQIHDSLESALAPMHDVVGFTARTGRERLNHYDLEPWAKTTRSEATLKNTALLFGPEDTGLRADHIEHCRSLVRIPSAAENPSFNLAQAVLLALYELSRGVHPKLPEKTEPSPATWAEVHELERKLDLLAEISGFNLGDQSAPATSALKHLLRRLQPNQREMAILLGFFEKAIRTLDK